MPTALKQESNLPLSPNPENSEVLHGQSKRLTCSLLCYKVSDKLEYVHQDCFMPENKPLNFKQKHVLLHLSLKFLWAFGKTHFLSFPRPGAGWRHSTLIYFKIKGIKTGQWVCRSGSLWYLTHRLHLPINDGVFDSRVLISDTIAATFTTFLQEIRSCICGCEIALIE